MAGATATYNSQSFDYVQWSESYDPVEDDGALIGYNRTFNFSAWVRYANYSAYSTGMTAIASALSTPAQTLQIKDPSTNVMREFGSAHVIDDGPYCTFAFRDHEAYGFWVDVTVTGGTAPGGTGSVVDTYTDSYSYDEQGACTYTRTGKARNTTAYASADAALDSLEPSPGNTYELQGRDGRLDEDMKEIDYTFAYKQFFETIPTQFKTFTYSMSQQKDGMKNSIRLSASAGVDYENKSEIENMADNLEKWAKGKLPDDSKIVSITPVENKREGTCAISVSAIGAIGGDIVEESESRTTTTTADYIIRKRAGGGYTNIIDLGDADTVYQVTGYKVGLSGHPKVSITGRSRSETYSDPTEGPDGELLYRVDYSYSTPLVGGGGQGGQAVGGGAAGSPPSGSSSSSATSSPPSGTGGGFSTGGLISGAAGGISGTRSGFATFG